MVDHHDVTMHNSPTPDDEGKGIQAIIRAFMRNPVAAVEIIGFIGGMYALYYTMNYNIADAKATSEIHYKELSSFMSTQYDKVNTRMESLLANDASQMQRIEAIYARGDTRYATIIGKLGEHDIDIARMATGIDYLVKQVEQGKNGSPHDQRGELVLPYPMPSHTVTEMPRSLRDGGSSR